jgi:hypothetical protein
VEKATTSKVAFTVTTTVLIKALHVTLPTAIDIHMKSRGTTHLYQNHPTKAKAKANDSLESRPHKGSRQPLHNDNKPNSIFDQGTQNTVYCGLKDIEK